MKTEKRTGSIKYPLDGPNPVLKLLPEKFWQKMVVNQNRHTGKLYEQIAASIVLSTLAEETDLSKLTISFDKQWFYCFPGNLKKRRFNIYIKELEIAYEVKSYRVSFNKFTRDQVQKDKWLLHNGKIREVRWLLFNGATKRTLQALTKNRIIYLDTTGDELNFTNIPELYSE